MCTYLLLCNCGIAINRSFKEQRAGITLCRLLLFVDNINLFISGLIFFIYERTTINFNDTLYSAINFGYAWPNGNKELVQIRITHL